MSFPHGTVIRPAIERFVEKVSISENGCYVWTGGLAGEGYGGFFAGRTGPGKHGRTSAHRWAYEQFVGPIPAGLEIDHLCRNRACVNPDHLEAVTPEENYRRSDGNHKKTHCPAGHPYDDENTYVSPAGGRICRACRGDNGRGIGWRAGLTECKHGHPFTVENTYVKPNGSRVCRACRRDTKRRYLARKAA